MLRLCLHSNKCTVRTEPKQRGLYPTSSGTFSRSLVYMGFLLRFFCASLSGAVEQRIVQLRTALLFSRITTRRSRDLVFSCLAGYRAFLLTFLIALSAILVLLLSIPILKRKCFI